MEEELPGGKRTQPPRGAKSKKEAPRFTERATSEESDSTVINTEIPSSPLIALEMDTTAFLQYLQAKDERDREERRREFDAMLRQRDRDSDYPPSPRDGSAHGPPKCKSYRPLGEDEDADDFFCGFEFHMRNHKIPEDLWVKELMPLLQGDTTGAVLDLRDEVQAVYPLVKTKILALRHITQSSYAERIEGFVKKPRETWQRATARLMKYYRKLTTECTTLEEGLNVIAKWQILAILPTPMAVAVQTRKPQSCDELGIFADEDYVANLWNLDAPKEHEHGYLTRVTRLGTKRSATPLTTPGRWPNTGSYGGMVRSHGYGGFSPPTAGPPPNDNRDRRGGYTRGQGIPHPPSPRPPARPPQQVPLTPQRGERRGQTRGQTDGRKLQVKCFGCQQYGHYKSECPEIRRLEAIHLVDALAREGVENAVTPAQQQELLKKTTEANMVVLEGRVDSQRVSEILLDPGAARTLVSGKWIKDGHLTNEWLRLETVNPGVQTYPVARVTMEVAGYLVELDVVRHDNLQYDVILGRDFPPLWELGYAEVNKALCHMVQTRSQTTQASTEEAQEEEHQGSGTYPLRSGEISSGTETEDSQEEDEIQGGQEPEVPVAEPAPLDKTPLTRSQKRRGRQAVANMNRLSAILDDGPAEVATKQQNDESLKPYFDKVGESDTFFIQEDLLWKKTETRTGNTRLLLVLPVDCRPAALRLAHRPGHLGRDRTKAMLLEQVWWPGLDRDVRKVCDSCPTCQRVHRKRSQVAPLLPLPVMGRPFQRVALDFKGPKRRTARGNQFIIVLMDYHSRWPEAKAVRTATSRVAAEFIIEVSCRFGVPDELLTDRGTHFVNTMCNTLCKTLGIHRIRTTAYHPETDGVVERFNSTMGRMLDRAQSAFRNQWDQALPLILGEYRSTPCRATGFTPAELMLGRNICTPVRAMKEQWTGQSEEMKPLGRYLGDLVGAMEEIADAAKEKEQEYKKELKAYHDKNAKEKTFLEGDLVLLREPKGFGPQAELEGPYPVVKAYGNHTYDIITFDGSRRHLRVHCNRLEAYRTPSAECLVVKAEEWTPQDLGPDIERHPREVQAPETEILLDKEDRRKFKKLITETYRDIIGENIGQTSAGEMSIILKSGQTPRHAVAYRLQPHKLPPLEEELKELLELGLIRPSRSQWASPIVLVPKPDGKMRLCVDYRKLNAATEIEQYPMPNSDDLITRLGMAKVLSTLDLRKGYYQVPMHPDSVKFTAFVTPLGKYEFTVMPFGLAGAPATFQCLMQTVLAGLVEHAAAYLDDIAVFSNNTEEHFEHLGTVLGRLREFSLTLRLPKCQFFRRQVVYLGHLVGRGEIRPLEAKVKAIQEYPRPPNKKTLRSFLGLVNYYHKFAKDMATIATPLYNALKGTEPDRVQWTEERITAFERLKQILSKDPVLKAPEMNRPYILLTDASGVGLGATLSQVNDEGNEYPIAYFSRTTTAAERNYTVTEQEGLAVVAAIRHFAYYLEGTTFKVITDHQSLTFLNRTRERGRLARWALALQPFHFTVHYRPGRFNQAADALSRAYQTDSSTPREDGESVAGSLATET